MTMGSRRAIGLTRLLFALGFSAVAALSLPAAEQSAKTGAEESRTAMAVEALSRLQGIDLEQNPRIKEAVLKVLEKTRGTAQFVKLVQQFNLRDQDAGLLEVAVQNSANEAGVAAMRLLLASRSFPLVRGAVEGTNIVVAAKAAEALGNTGEKDAAPLLLPLITQ